MKVSIALVEKPHWSVAQSGFCPAPPSLGSLVTWAGANSPSLLPVPPPVPKGTLPPALFPWEMGGGGEGRMFWRCWYQIQLSVSKFGFFQDERTELCAEGSTWEPYRCFNLCVVRQKYHWGDGRLASLTAKVMGKKDLKFENSLWHQPILPPQWTQSLDATPKPQVKWINYDQSWKVPGTRSHWEFSAKMQMYSKNAFRNIDLYLWKSLIKQKRIHKEKMQSEICLFSHS